MYNAMEIKRKYLGKNVTNPLTIKGVKSWVDKEEKEEIWAHIIIICCLGILHVPTVPTAPEADKGREAEYSSLRPACGRWRDQVS